MTARGRGRTYGDGVSTFTPRFIGRAPGRDGRFARVVDQVTIHGQPLDFRQLCARAVPRDTRYLVLDLDRTLHFGRNMGELFGWELTAYYTYGPEHLARVEPHRAPGRFLIDPSRPLELARYLARGALAWAYPGLFYLFWGRIAAASATTRRQRYLRFGPDPRGPIQEVATLAFLHELARLPLSTARELMATMLARFAGDQVIERDDIEWLRRRCPGIEIVLSSASPQPVVEAAAGALGITTIDHTTLTEKDGYLGSPPHLHPLYLEPRLPRHITPPDQFEINAGLAKIARLQARFPDFSAPDTVTVGITDTGHREDHCWAHYFHTVVDINSPTPFPPVVAADSPLRAIHSAAVLTRRERRSRDRGEADYLDPRRSARPIADARFDGDDLTRLLDDLLAEVEDLAAGHHALLAGPSPAVDAAARARADVDRRLDRAVADYNAAAADPSSADPRAARDRVAALVRRRAAATRVLQRARRPRSLCAYEIDRRLDAARARLDSDAATAPAPRALTAPTADHACSR